MVMGLALPSASEAATLLQSKYFNLYHHEADTLTSDGTTSIPSRETGHAAELVRFDPFDTRLGVLTGVTLSLTSDQQVNGAFALDGRGAINTAPVSFTARLNLGGEFLDGYWTSSLETDCSAQTLNGCIRVEVAHNDVNAFWTLSDLNLFTGTGPVEIAADSVSSLGVVPFFYNGIARIAGSHAWDGDLVLAYDYSPVATPSAVPEPEIWAFMVLGFGFAGVALRLRRNAGLPARR
jgi:hypothetical protein